MSGFVTTIAGVLLLVAMVKGNPGAWYFAPGLFFIGLGLGIMLTPSVNMVQSAFPEHLQGEISGVSRSVSNLGRASAPPSPAPSWCPVSPTPNAPTPAGTRHRNAP